jgi:hypothetical protein
MFHESYPHESDFCDLCGCSGKVYLVEDDGVLACQNCLQISYFEDVTNEE